MSPTARRFLAIAAALFVLSLAACEDASTPPVDTGSTLRPTGGTSTGVEAVDCPAVAAGEVALTPVAVPPEPSEPVGSHGEVEGYNEEEVPPVPVDPDGVLPDRDDFDPSAIPPTGSQGEPQPDDLILFGGGATDVRTVYSHQTAEPEVAMKGRRVFLTWNTMAARSLDAGETFEYLPPQTSFPRADGGVCCDQRSIHVPRHDLWLWVLQYETGPDEANTIRLAWAHGDEEFDAARFRYVDWRPPDVGLDDGAWFDQPKLGVSDEHAFLSINAFREGQFVGAVVIRASLADMVEGDPPASSCLTPVEPDSGESLFGAYPVRQAGDTMYLAAHKSTSALAIWSWPDDSTAPTYSVVIGLDSSGNPVNYPRNIPYTCQRQAAGASSDWCFRPVRGEPNRSANDDRITSGWYDDGTIGFAWNASQGGRFEYPFVWAVVIDAARVDACAQGECIVGYPIIFNDNHAFQYGAIAGNGAGGLGGVVLFGGGERYLSCAVVAREGFGAGTGWDLTLVASSPTDMPTPNSGDYLGVAADGEVGTAWSGGCMTYDPELSAEGGGTVVHFVRFGRRSEEP